MTSKNIGLVVEGVTDYEIIRCLIGARYDPIGLTLNFIHLQPARDATSGWTHGGWSNVFQWCVRNDLSKRKSFFRGRGLFASSAYNCDVLIVQLDGDIAQEIKDTARIPSPSGAGYNLASIPQKSAFVRDSIAGWLDLNAADDELAKMHIPSAAVECSEAWVVAATSLSDDAENDPNMLIKFVSDYCHTLNKPVPHPNQKLRKKMVDYNRYLGQKNIDPALSVATCSNFRHLVDALDGVLI